MRRTLTLLPLMALAVACGPMPVGEPDGEVVVRDDDREITAPQDEQTDEDDPINQLIEAPPDDEPPAWEEWGGNGLSELSAVMTGQVGEHFISSSLADQTRAQGDYFGDEGWQSIFIDSRVDVDGENAMIMVMLDGDLMSGALQDGIKLVGEDEFLMTEEGEIFASVRACTGPEDEWDYDVPADEAEIEMTPDEEDPDVVVLSVAATFVNPDTGVSEAAKAVFRMRLGE
jgi:hypothetical protein